MLLKDNLQGIQHLGLCVANLERSMAFYSRLGFSEVMRTDISADRETIRVSMMRHENLTIELFQLGIAASVPAIRRGNFDHVAMTVRDVASAYEEIRNAGIEIVEDDAPVSLPFWHNGVRFFTVRGPDGEKIEFNQIL